MSAGPALALDLGASRIRAAVVDPGGRVHSRRSSDTPGAAGPGAVVQACLEQLRAVLDDCDTTTRAAIVGLGISAPGPVNPRAGVLVDPPNIGAGFRDVPLAEPLGRELGLAVALERDTNVAALAELTYGVARGASDFLYLTVSTGIGGSIVARGKVYGGADGMAGEIGHVSVALDWPPCGCGGAGHLEATSSGSGIARQARLAIEAGRAPGLAARQDRVGAAPLTARDVAEAEDAGDPGAATIMEFARRSFASAMVGLVDVFNPELIVVGGSLARGQGDRLLEPARTEVKRVAFAIAGERVRIVPAALGDDVGLLGAQPLLALALGT